MNIFQSDNFIKIETGKYLWKTKDVDMPVTVIGLFGTDANGKVYVKILESDSGIPLDELKKEKNVSNSRKPQPKRLI